MLTPFIWILQDSLFQWSAREPSNSSYRSIYLFLSLLVSMLTITASFNICHLRYLYTCYSVVVFCENTRVAESCSVGSAREYGKTDLLECHTGILPLKKMIRYMPSICNDEVVYIVRLRRIHQIYVALPRSCWRKSNAHGTTIVSGQRNVSSAWRCRNISNLKGGSVADCFLMNWLYLSSYLSRRHMLSVSRWFRHLFIRIIFV